MTGLLGVDIGGTFTDVVLAVPGRPLVSGKYLTTPSDPTEGVLGAVSDVLRRSGVDPSAISRVAHATTLATNVILERRGVAVAFVTTKGFRSMLTLGRAARVEEQRYDLFFDPPPPPVPASHCFEVHERTLAGGKVLRDLDEADARRAATAIAELGVVAVAVCFLHSYANPVNEQRMVQLLRAHLPGTTIVASSQTWPELREYERATTTLMSAYVGPIMAGYLAGLSRRLAAIGVVAPVHIMESSGGVMSLAMAAERPVYTIESGPAAGVMAVQAIGADMGIGDLISFDMGGTTAKAGVIRNGVADVTHRFHVGGSGSFGGRREGTGIPLKIPAVDLAEVGAGGGSIAWIDAGGTLRVGPQSAGAQPGPACYGRGGDQPTVTDADLVLGYLDATTFAGGTVPLYPERASSALRRQVCDPLGIGLAEAAFAIHEIANANMGSAVGVVTVQRGIDPRRFSLVALGGAGPAHVARIAERFGIGRVVVPIGAGVGSAIGLLRTDMSTERSKTSVMPADSAGLAAIETIVEELTEAGLADLQASRQAVSVRPAVDMRYLGQAHELTIAAPEGPLDGQWLAELQDRFRAQYQAVYGTAQGGAVELVSFRVRVVLPVSQPDVGAPTTPAPPTPAGERAAWSPDDDRYVPTPVHQRSGLRPGDRFDGPVIIEQTDATVIVPRHWAATVDAGANLILDCQSRHRRRPAEAITADILRHALVVAAEEASIVVVRSAYSTFIVEGSDASAAIFDGAGRLIAQSTATSLAHMASLRMCVRTVLEDFAPDGMADGDVYVMNDSYRGGIHANDLAVIQPVFVEGEVRFLTGTLIHVSDVGGSSAGGMHATATDIFQEGLQLPPVKLADAAGLCADIAHIIALNSRSPESVLGDIGALMAGTTVARRRMEALVDEYGMAALSAGIEDYLAYAERMARRELACFPSGTYRGSYLIDNDGIDLERSHRVEVAVTIDGDRAVVDFEGTSPQVAAAINCSLSQTTSGAIYGLRCFLDPTIPMNEGFLTPFDIKVPPGSLLNPIPPVPTGGRFVCLYAVIDAIIRALSQAKPDHAVAASGILTPYTIASAQGPHWAHMAYDFGGVGGRHGRDGPDATGLHFGIGRNTIPQVEPVELRCPLIVEGVELIADSAGTGRWRGGAGSRSTFLLLEDSVLTMRCDRYRFPPAGIDGGGTGRPGGYFVVGIDGSWRRLPDKAANVAASAGERFVVETSGGGGVGEAGQRPLVEVESDVAAGVVSADGAAAYERRPIT